MYRIIRNVLFQFDAEKVHHFSMQVFSFFCGISVLKKAIAGWFTLSADPLQRNVLGLGFRNPVGLAAGFDKNARYLRELECVGFGFVEVGTVTPLPQTGNEKPRLFRLPADRALLNRMGFNNDGVKVVADRLRRWKSRHPAGSSPNRLIIGGNIGKNKLTPNEDAWKDYETCFNALFEYVDYFVVNVSSPNTPGLRELQEKEALSKILAHLQMINDSKLVRKPLLLKIAPDLSVAQLDQIIELCEEVRLDGLVVCNTTIQYDNLSSPSMEKIRNLGSGGLSGAPLKKRSTEMLAYISSRTGGKLTLIASGGIFNAEDALEKIRAGAALVQVWTGFVYEGPATARNICRGILEE
jgi:dihydroorotate dehydrogenase